MPLPKTIRVYPIDLQKNTAVGVSLPFNGKGVFNKTFTTKDQIKSNLVNLILTNKGERVFNPEFGADLKRVLFEGITEDTVELVQNLISDAVRIFLPEITLVSVDVNVDDRDNNTITISINYYLNVSEEADQVVVQFI
jgi:phage baseplate assembly protein W